MSSHQITLFHHGIAPNPPKELGDGENGVKAPDFVAINPNGRVPAIIDHTSNDKIVWESGAILLYLAERFDTSGKYNGKDLDEKAVVWEWLMFQMSGLGPMQGQYNYFRHFRTVKDFDQSVYDRFKNETVADMAIYPWLHISHYLELTFDEFPHLKAYVDRISKLQCFLLGIKSNSMSKN